MNNAFQYAHASNENIDTLLDTITAQLHAPFTQSLGIIYITDNLHDQLDLILNHIQDHTGIPHWSGTVGMGIIGGDTEYYDEPAIAILLCDISTDEFTMLPTSVNTPESDILQLKSLQNIKTSPSGLLHADPQNPDIQILLKQLYKHSPNSRFIGGLSSSRGTLPQICDTLTSGGISGVVFSDNITITTNLSQGCTPIGPAHDITRFERNLVISLDNNPALQVLKNDIGEVLARDLKRAAGYIFTGIPTKSNHADDYMIRNLIGTDESNDIFAIGDFVQAGQQLMFCRRDGNTAQKDMIRMLETTKQKLKTAPRGGIYISCLGRGRYQFGDNSEEAKMIKSVLGEFPLIGFYANGEIFNSNLYSFTGVLMLFE